MKGSYGFNGKEKDDEMHGNSGDSYDYGNRIYDTRLSRFLSVDPFSSKYPELTTYQYASNTPIWAIDVDGLEKFEVTKVGDKYLVKITAVYGLITQGENAVKIENTKTIQESISAMYQNATNQDVYLSEEQANKIGETKKGFYKFDVIYDITVIDVKDGSNFSTAGENSENAGVVMLAGKNDMARFATGNTNAPEAPAATNTSLSYPDNNFLDWQNSYEEADKIRLNPNFFGSEISSADRDMLINNYVNAVSSTTGVSYNAGQGAVIGHEIGHDLGQKDHLPQGVSSIDNRNDNMKATEGNLEKFIRNAINSGKITKPIQIKPVETKPAETKPAKK